MTISSLPTAPSRTDDPVDFVTKADAFIAALPTFQEEANALAVEMNAIAGAVSAGTVIAIPLTFRSSTTDSDPGADGAGSFRLNNAALASVTQIYVDGVDNASTDITGLVDTFEGSTSPNKGQLRLSKNSTNYALYTVTDVTTATGYRKITVTYLSSAGSFSAADVVTMYFTRSGDVGTFSGDLANAAIANIKIATFYQVATLSTTTGTVNIDWSAAQNYKQTEPTGNITYTFTAPPGPCHVQLHILSDGVSTARTFSWPATVKWLGASFLTTATNKNAFINFFYDGTSYWGQGISEV